VKDVIIGQPVLTSAIEDDRIHSIKLA
jgi:hypothetical protein